MGDVVAPAAAAVVEAGDESGCLVEMTGEPPLLGSPYLDMFDYSIVLVSCSLTSEYEWIFVPFDLFVLFL